MVMLCVGLLCLLLGLVQLVALLCFCLFRGCFVECLFVLLINNWLLYCMTLLPLLLVFVLDLGCSVEFWLQGCRLL